MHEPHINFDTHKHIEFLIGKGLKKAQAESIVEVISQSRSYDFSKLSTKDQLKILEAALKGEIAELRAELKGGMSKLKEEIMVAIQTTKNDLLKWMIPLFISIMLAILLKN